MKFLLASAAFLVTITLAAAEKKVQVIVVTEMTREGKKLVRPDPAHPAYYVPVVGGFKEHGALVQGEKHPSPQEVVRLVTVTLANQGYLESKPAVKANAQGEIIYADGTVVTVPASVTPGSKLALNARGNVPLTTAMLDAPAGTYSLHTTVPAAGGRGQMSPALEVLRAMHPKYGPVVRGMPSLMIGIHWGYMNPQIDSPSEPVDTHENPFYNQREMTALVGFNTPLLLGREFEDILQASKDNRYFIVLSAYDFPTYRRTQKKVLLWQAKISVPSDGTQFEDVMATLLKAGGPLIGRQALRPKMLLMPVTPEGKVTIGNPTLMDYTDAPSPASPAPGTAK